VKRATEASYGIILQFPFYAGIFGIMAYTGLLQAIANWFGSMATPFIYPLVVMISAGIINIFIPSSGGIWMVQGPPTIMAAGQLGVSFNRVAMAFTAGEVITNAIQPFWALPLLGATKTEMRNIMGYCIVSTRSFHCGRAVLSLSAHVNLPLPGEGFRFKDRPGTLAESSGSLLPKAGGEGSRCFFEGGQGRPDPGHGHTCIFGGDALL
jgi:hypothetical protein